MHIFDTGGYLSFLGVPGHLIKKYRFCRFNRNVGDLLNMFLKGYPSEAKTATKN